MGGYWKAIGNDLNCVDIYRKMRESEENVMGNLLGNLCELNTITEMIRLQILNYYSRNLSSVNVLLKKRLEMGSHLSLLRAVGHGAWACKSGDDFVVWFLGDA